MYNSNMNENIRLFVDGAGRYVLGVITAETENILTVKNPALVVVNVGSNNQIQIQTIPFFFKELTTGTDDTYWEFFKNNCAIATQIGLNENIISQYYNAISTKQQQQQQPKVVKLFDE